MWFWLSTSHVPHPPQHEVCSQPERLHSRKAEEPRAPELETCRPGACTVAAVELYRSLKCFIIMNECGETSRTDMALTTIQQMFNSSVSCQHKQPACICTLCFYFCYYRGSCVLSRRRTTPYLPSSAGIILSWQEIPPLSNMPGSQLVFLFLLFLHARCEEAYVLCCMSITLVGYNIYLYWSFILPVIVRTVTTMLSYLYFAGQCDV